MGNRDYIIRRFIEKPRQNNRYRFTNFTEKPRRYVKPHPSTRYRKETNTAEKPNIEQNTNYQKTLAEYARRLEKIHEELKQLLEQLTTKLDLDTKETKWSRKIIERYYDQFQHGTLHPPNAFNRKTQITESDKGP